MTVSKTPHPDDRRIPRLGMLASHRGSNVRTVIEACRRGILRAVPAVVISNNADAPVLDLVRAEGIPAVHIGGESYRDSETRDRAVLGCLRSYDVDLVLLLGYLRKLGPQTVDAYRGRILNVHPALLPKYGGVGMYGLNVHRAVIAAGDTVTGVSIHWVDELYDHGQLVGQCIVPVLDGDTAETLEQRVLERGHQFLVETLATLLAP